MTNRKEPPRERNGRTYEIRVGGATVYIVTGEYDDGSLAEIFLTFSKAGSTLQGFADWIAVTTSIALQHGVALADLARIPSTLRFEPHGITNDPVVGDVGSLAEAVFKRLAADYG